MNYIIELSKNNRYICVANIITLELVQDNNEENKSIIINGEDIIVKTYSDYEIQNLYNEIFKAWQHYFTEPQ